ncbi:MAG: hypothetical protein COB26_03060 [Piscirickettsiaceae bacterium]|nr:MAG: hypothetical protein COB26_03060 [Piscirickettsiaceae bacterium]
MFGSFKNGHLRNVLLKSLNYGVLIFLVLFFALPSSKGVNTAFYLIVLLPCLLLFKELIKTKGLSNALLPIILTVLFWAVFSVVSLDANGWENVAKRFRHALYIITFIVIIYYVLSNKTIGVKNLIVLVFGLATVYSLYSFIDCYFISDHNFSTRLFPVLRLDSPIFMSIILVVFSVPLLSDAFKNNKKMMFVFLLFIVSFFLYFYNSRAGIVAMIFGVLSIFLTIDLKGKKAFAVGIILLMLMAVVIGFNYGNFFVRGGSYRLEIWFSSIQKMLDCGLLLGCGLGGNSEITIGDGKVFQHSHNIFLSHLVNTGLFGLISLLGLLVLVIVKGLKNHSIMVYGLLAGLVGLMFDGKSLITNPNAIWLIFWLPLVIICWENNNNKTSVTKFNEND